MSNDKSQPICELCGEPMPPGEEMFKFHGYSGPCPKPPKQKPAMRPDLAAIRERAEKAIYSCYVNRDQAALSSLEIVRRDIPALLAYIDSLEAWWDWYGHRYRKNH